jgi:hypothetical protein
MNSQLVLNRLLTEQKKAKRSPANSESLKLVSAGPGRPGQLALMDFR